MFEHRAVTPRIFEAFESAPSADVFDPAPQPQRLCASLAERFGFMDMQQLRRIVDAESAAALSLSTQGEVK